MFDSVKVFSATMGHERNALGEKITDWIARERPASIGDVVIRQSSDDGFHCLSITLFYKARR